MKTEIEKLAAKDAPVCCHDCGREITDFQTAERVEVDPSMDHAIWYCEHCRAEAVEREATP